MGRRHKEKRLLAAEMEATDRQSAITEVSIMIHLEKLTYADYLTTDDARKNIDEFDCLLPEYAWVSDTKKIDCLLWSKR